jgi:hypothetical protein
MNAGEHVEERSLVRGGEANAVGGDHRHAEGTRQTGQRDEVGFLVAQQMPLQLNADIGAAKQTDQPIEQPADAVVVRVKERPSRQRHEAGGEAVEFVERERALAFRGAHLHARDEAAEIAVAVCRCH